MEVLCDLIFKILTLNLGELKERLQNLTRFSEEITRFYTAEILTTLKYLHTEMKIAYE